MGSLRLGTQLARELAESEWGLFINGRVTPHSESHGRTYRAAQVGLSGLSPVLGDAEVERLIESARAEFAINQDRRLAAIFLSGGGRGFLHLKILKVRLADRLWELFLTGACDEWDGWRDAVIEEIYENQRGAH